MKNFKQADFTTPKARPVGRQINMLTTGQVAEYFGVTSNTILQWIKQGILPAWRQTERGWHYIDDRQIDVIEAKFKAMVNNDPDFISKFRKLFPRMVYQMENPDGNDTPEEGDTNAGA